MTGEKNITDCICSRAARALLIPQGLFTSKIMTNPQALMHLSKTLVNHLKANPPVNGNPRPATTALVQSDDPYGFELRTEDPMKLLIINCGGIHSPHHGSGRPCSRASPPCASVPGPGV